MKIYSLKDAHLKKSTRVIVRADFDVPIEQGKIREDFRIHKVIPAIKYILRRGGKIRLIAHLGRPKGKIKRSLSLKPVARYLERVLQRRVILIADPFDKKTFEKHGGSPEILLFENLRFWPGEENNSRVFAKSLARWADIYVNEAFADSHRAHASMVRLAKLLPAFSGLNLASELYYLDTFLRKPRHPYIAVIGGIKLETKLPLVKHFLKKADQVLVGSGFAGKLPSRPPKKLYVPLDYITSKGQKVDIGPQTRAFFKKVISRAKTVVWNGPLGNTPYFPEGTLILAKALAGLASIKIIGGGDTIAALQKAGISLKSFTHVSSGGGAMLEQLVGKKLPGIEALRR